MSRVGVIFIVLLIGFIPTVTWIPSEGMMNPEFKVTQSGSEGPVIGWIGAQGNETMVIAWDGVYTGQSQEVWRHLIQVNDTDGVDTVIFMYRWISESEWTNKTGVLIEGNETVGWYVANFTYAVWWDYDTGRVMTEGNGGNFHFKIFANDTLGNWNMTGILTYMGGYMLVNPPPDAFIRSPLGLGIIGTSVAVVVVVLVVVFRRHR